MSLGLIPIMSDLYSSSPPEADASLGQQFSQIISGVQQYLMQERDLFGNIIYPSAQQSTANNTLKEKTAGDYHAEPWAGTSSLVELNSMICECQKCSLGATRTKFVFGVGNPKAEIVIIGEAPGADEDAKGEPFVGRAGQLLNKILEAIHFKREEVYICNILKCRPPGNRDPLPEEVQQCEPYLWKQLEIIKPKIILCLGRISAQVLLKTADTLTKLRENVHDYRGIPLLVTYHPAALLRNPNWKRPTWEDVQKLRKMYDEMKKN
jgi:uracil-DNA glycosylase